ncbi:MAG TPA: UDP-N-acetylglucosamine--N-acetylmuramyl-(pentapeptide) pyrophosphoryl-undecaprenol N-acetylglucosamine transferase [Candidatus Paceibacterota bacterium]
MKILFTGGGTGGHILPIIAISRELRRSYTQKDLELYYMGPEDRFGDILLGQERIRVLTVGSGKIRRGQGMGGFFPNLFDMFFKTPWAIVKAFRMLFLLSPDLIFSKGGYGAIPATAAGRLLRIPVFLHEGDIIPGKANRAAEKFAVEIFASFPHTRYFSPKKLMLVGNPIRREMFSGSKEEAVKLFNLQGGKPVLLIMGGSQGATRVNDMLLVILDQALNEFEIIHQTGDKNFHQVQTEAEVVMSEQNAPYYHPVGFMKETELRHAYAAADLIVSRAGSGSIFEIAALGKPSILIPLPESAQNHQVANAYAYAQTGAAFVLEQPNLQPHFFLQRVKDILYEPAEIAEMREAASRFARPNAAKVVGEYLLTYLLQ